MCRNIKFSIPNSIRINNQFWFESHFYAMPSETRDSIKKLINNINIENLRNMKEKLSVYSIGSASYPLGFIIVYGQQIPVYIGNFNNSDYNYKNNNAIRIPYGNFNPDIMLQNIEHEVGHALDKKIKNPAWRGTSKTYIDAVNKILAGKELTGAENLAYDKEPVEVDAIGASYDNYVKRNFETEDLATKKMIIDRLSDWLRYDGEVPYFIKEIEDRWRTKPTLWKKFKQKVYNLVQELKNKIDNS